MTNAQDIAVLNGYNTIFGGFLMHKAIRFKEDVPFFHEPHGAFLTSVKYYPSDQPALDKGNLPAGLTWLQYGFFFPIRKSSDNSG